MCEGWVRFLIRDNGGNPSDLQNLGTGKDKNKEIFGMTWIFPWARSIIQLRPNCIMSDGTFACMQPYTLEVLEVVFANESIPIGLGVSPIETEASYEGLYTNLSEVLEGEDKERLKRIPFISDQGQGLKAFARNWSLLWSACHRHLIEGVGASSMGGDWMCRLLKCASLGEAQKCAETIRKEMEALRANGRSPGSLWHEVSYSGLLTVMLDPVDQNNKDVLKFWARWRRFSCPTTINVAEAIHRVLNEATKHCRCFCFASLCCERCIVASFFRAGLPGPKREAVGEQLGEKARENFPFRSSIEVR
jgi:hypothetical protein